MDLAATLTAMAREYELALALIVGRDGLLVEGYGDIVGEDLEAIAAGAVRALVDLERLSKSLRAGNLARTRIFFDQYQLLMEHLAGDDILVAGIASSERGERLLDAVAACRKQLVSALGDL